MIIQFPSHSFGRRKPTFRKRGQVIENVIEQLRERSKGKCERCCNGVATEVVGQGKVDDLVHLCPSCKVYCENRIDGQIFIKQFGQIRRSLNAKH